jgi:hypothetical protein
VHSENMTSKQLALAVLSIPALALSPASAAEVYSGEPLDEALFDLACAATRVSHELASASPLVRTVVFRLHDGRLLAVTARAKKRGQPFTVETLRVTPSAEAKLTNRLPTPGPSPWPNDRDA